MGNFNFLNNRKAPTEIASKDGQDVRTRATGSDRFAGLRGRQYIDARKLNAPVQRVQTSALLKKRD